MDQNQTRYRLWTLGGQITEMHDTLEEAEARLFALGACDVTRESSDGSTTYYYETEDEADADDTGSYASSITEMRVGDCGHAHEHGFPCAYCDE